MGIDEVYHLRPSIKLRHGQQLRRDRREVESPSQRGHGACVLALGGLVALGPRGDDAEVQRRITVACNRLGMNNCKGML